MFYLVPIERVGNYRGPRFLKWRFGEGARDAWALKDFGADAPIGLVKTHAPALAHTDDALALNQWTLATRARVRGYLSNAGIESGWVCAADSLREAWHRISGLTQAYQAGIDAPHSWLYKPVHFGFFSLRPFINKPKIQPILFHRSRAASAFKARPRLGMRALLRLVLRAPLLALLMALPATDSFTTATNQALTAYSANWSLNSGDFQVDSSDVVVSNANAECGAFWNADAFNASQYAQVVRVAVGTDWLGPAVRCAGAGVASYYGFYTNGAGSETYLFKNITNTWTQLGSAGSVNIVAGDTLRAEMTGTTLTPIRNAATYSSIGAQTDSSLSSGSGGLCGYGLATLANSGDSWEAGNLIANNTEPQLIQRRRGFAVYGG